MLSKVSIETISDLIANRLAIMTISDQNDLREKLVLERALVELRDAQGIVALDAAPAYLDIPRRGRRRKVKQMMGGA